LAYFVSRIAVSLIPRWAESHVLLAGALINLRRFDEALGAWERALVLKPDWQNNYPSIMAAFLLCGQARAGRSVMQSYLDMQNNFAMEHQLDKLGTRFLIEFTTNIGHIALLDSYVKMGVLGQRSTARPIVLVSPGLPNPCYLDYWRYYLPDMIADPLALELLSPLAKYLEDHLFAVMDSSGQQTCEFHIADSAIQEQWESEGRGPLLTLTDLDKERGWDCLQTLGIPPDAWFVGLHVRDTSFRDNRDSDVNTYRPAIESVVARGGWVIRMGDPTMKPLPPMPQVIDYAHSSIRSDWMDVFLWASCRFFIGTNSGPVVVPPTFGVPCVIANWASLGMRPWFSKNLQISKLYWSEREARYLNFAEVISSALAFALSTNYLASQGIKFVDNTPEEINEVVVEMLDRLEGKPLYSKEDDELQARFDRLYTSNPFKANARIGRDFLRKWGHLL
jgi:putative glycosyltransferase (TIGR04372 family)